jgi:cytochrome c-type biogenesis protein CcmH/NrfG
MRPDTMTHSPRPRRRSKTDRLDPHTRLGLTPQASAEDLERAHRELVSLLEGAPESMRRWAQQEIAAADEAYAALSHPASGRSARRPSSLRRLAVGTLTLAVTVGVVVGVYDIGGGQSKAKAQQAATAAPHGLNASQQARVSQLMMQLQAQPKDAATLIQLGDIFFEAHDYNGARGWMKRAVAAAPGDLRARMALGAAEFNNSDAADAQRDWLRVISADPKNVEAYYDLGFLYVSRTPPDMADAKKMWGKVIALAPNSTVAKTVATHIKGLAKE